MVNGSNSTSGGGGTSITISKSVLQKGFFQPGRLVLVMHDTLPAWAGVVDTPIGLLAPAPITIYNIEYLLKLRSPDAPQKLTGTVASIVGKMIEQANRQEEMYVRLGVAGGSTTYREEVLDQRSYWEQLNAIVARSGSEMIFRPQREPSDGNRLYVYVDILDRAGVDTDFLLHDGQGGNVKLVGATIEREIWNRVIGINGSSSAEDRLTTAPQVDTVSAATFRLRSQIQQFRGTVLQSTLLEQTQQYVREYSTPVLRFQAQVMDVGDTFRNMERGNGVILHASKVVLPDGRTGWRGTARILAMAYNERQKSLGMTLEAKYDI